MPTVRGAVLTKDSTVSSERWWLTSFIVLVMISFAVMSLVILRARRISADTGTGSVSLTTIGAAVTQNFDTLSNTAGSTTNTTLPTGWYITETGGGARDNEQYAVDTGASTTGDIYSYGAAASTDRALGALRSGTLIPLFGAKFTNNTGMTISSLDVTYTGEEWRLGTAARTDQINFEISTNATDLSTGTYTGVAALNFVTPDTVTTGAKNGNAAGDRTTLTATIPGLSIANGASFFIRWTDTDASGADDGLSVDDFSLTPQVVVQPNLTINDVSLNEGNAGTTSFTFTVSLSAPAGAGGVTFDIATADGTAVAPGDYTAKSLTGQTIPAGSSTYSFTVLVNGDTAPETNETFFVNVTNITGALVTDGQGQGTIVNDDAAPNLTINDVSLNEGNAGTTTFTFTVSLSAPAPAGGVTFDIATADGTATAPGDYTAKSLTGQTIPAGSSTYTFDVLVNGDTTPENNETFFVNVTNVTNAITVDGQGQGTIINDDITKIHDVQGNGAATPIPGATVTVEGVVVANFQGTNKLQGFFLQEEDADADADPATSEGIFVFCSSCPTAVAEGQRVRATGAVSEFNNMTEITASAGGSVIVTDAGNHLAEVTPSVISLPVVGVVDAFYEAREGMLVTFADTLTVSEYFELGRFGQIELFQGGRPRQFTEAAPPNVAGNTAHLDELNRRRVILDDDNNAQEWYLTTSTPPGPPDGSQFVFYPQANGGFSVGTQGVDFFRGGDLVNGLTGVLHWSFPGFGADTWRIRPTAAHPVTFTVANPRPVTPPAVGGSIKAVGMNLLNYFTTIDTTSSNSSGPCGPGGGQDCRGADSVAELNRQRERASIVICSLNADVYALMELENTTPSATITDLLGAVNARCGGAHPYAFANTGGTLGTDAIRVQLIYRTGVVSPVGSPLVDLDPIHNRPPTAQTFDVVDPANPAFGERFTVIANHFKSKGCDASATGSDADAGDGQSCYNGRRTAQAARLLTWINGTVLPAAGDPDVLLLGDFNSYAQENPVTTLAGGGFTDLETALLGANAYSYLFDGQLGHLDYAFANTSLSAKVTGVGAWHINADEVDLFDYNDEIKDAGESTFEEKPDGSALVPPRVVFQPGTPYRASDHDPVLVGLFPPCNYAQIPTITPGGPTTFCAGGSVNLTSSSADTYQWNLEGNPIGGAMSQQYVATASGNYTVTVTVGSCSNTSDPTVVTVNPIPATPTITPGGPTTVCPGGSVPLTSSSASGNQWYLNGNPIGGATSQQYIATASGDYTVIVTASGCSSAASAATTVTVGDTQPPIVTCPGPIIQSTDPNVCTAVVMFADPTVTDNCPPCNSVPDKPGQSPQGTIGCSVACTPASGSTFPKGVTTVTCTGTDASSNTAQCSFTVTVNDTQAPSITCPSPITQATDPNVCTAVVTYTTPTGSDNCPLPPNAVVCSPASNTVFPKGTTTVTCTLTYGPALTTNCMFTVTVTDNVAPVMSGCTNVSAFTAANACNAVVTYTQPTANDNCDGSRTVTCNPASGTTFSKGVTTVSCSASDTSGNPANCTFTVTVTDNVAPVLSGCNNVSANTASNACTAVVTYTQPTANDNCDGARTVTCTPASGTTFNKGVTTVSCSATDTSSQTGTCTFTVTVNDITAPSIMCPSNVTHGTDPGVCTAAVTYANATATDTCPGVGTPVCTPASGSTFPKGVTTVSCTVSDASSNTANCTFTVTVNDTQNPTVTCPANMTFTTPGANDLCGVVTYATPSGSDNCAIQSVVCLPASGTCFPVGMTTVTCTATDTSGNQGTCTFKITVQSPCTITCPANITKNNDPNQCGAVVTFAPTTTGGGCGTVSCSPASGSFFPKGTTTVTCTTAGPSCSFTVTVNDTQPPVFPNGCPAGITRAAQASCPIATTSIVTYTNPVATDNCAPPPTVVCNPPSGGVFPPGTTTVTCTATDSSGNTAICTFPLNLYSFCLQDDSTDGNVVFVNALTGEYLFCQNGVPIASGTGTLVVHGCNFQLDHTKGDRKVHIQGDTSANSGAGVGTAFISKSNGPMILQITDRKMSNDTCTCSPAPPPASSK